MLLNLRDIVSGWLAIVIVALLIIPFAFWGINYYFDQGGPQVIAKVNDREISLSEYQRAYQNYRQQLRYRLGEAGDLPDNELLRQEALNTLIENEVIKQMTRAARMRVGDDTVVDTISSIQVFQDENGQFSQARYQQAMQRVGMTSGSFEQQLRNDILLEQLQSAIIETAFVTDREVNRLGRIEAQKRDIVYTTVNAQAIREGIEVSDEDIQAYYQENGSDYREPEKVKIAYLELSIDNLLGEVSVTDADLRAYYENNKAAYNVEEARKISQLYIKLAKDADEAEVQEAQEQMDFISEKLEAGESFEEIANNYENRLGPDFEQISLGMTPQGVMDSKLDEKAFAMQEDEISELIRTDSGLHILRVDEIRAQQTQPLEEIRDRIEEDYRRYQAEQLYFEYADRLATLAYEHPNELEPAAEELGLEIQSSDWFTQQGGEEGLIADDSIVVTSYSDEVLQDGLNSEPIELNNSRMVVLRVDEHQRAQAIPLEQVREDIVDAIKSERARQTARKRGQAIITALRDGETLEQVAEEFGIEWQQADGVSRDTTDISRSVLRTAFQAGQPQEGQSVYDGATLGSGDYIIVGVSRVETPATDALTTEQTAELREQLLQAQALNAWRSVIDNARTEADVKVYGDNINL